MNILRVITRYGFAGLLLLPRFGAAGLGDITGVQLLNNTLVLRAGDDLVVCRVCLPNVLMVNYRPEGVEDADTLVIASRSWPAVAASFDTSGDPLVIQTGALRMTIARSPLRFSLYAADGRLLLREPQAEGLHAGGVQLEVQGEHFYGIHNSATGSLTRDRGGVISAGKQGEAGAPWVWTSAGYGVLMDTDGGQIILGSGSMNFLKNPGGKRDIELYLITGSPRELFAGLTAVSGAPPLFPKFALGFLNTEWGTDQAELLADVRTYRAKQLPLDAYILDFDWMAYGQDNYGEFRWGPKFPDGPTGALKARLDSMGVRLFGIRKPRVHVHTEQGQFALNHGYFVDQVTDYFTGQRVGRLNFHLPAVREWFYDAFVRRGNSYNRGIIGYWNDEADEYGGNMMFMQMQRASYEGQRAFNQERVWSINRNFYLGAQRYAYGHWSGDIATGFEAMAQQRLFMLSSITLGSAWWGMDIGGFSGRPSPENYIRWMQFGTFVPIFRVHGTYGQEREPWQYGPEAERVVTKYLRLRYALLPYLYSHAWENHRTGLALVRPLVIDHPDDPNVANLFSQWMLGDNLLVAPVVAAGARTQNLYLPAGEWIDYWTGTVHSGPRTVALPISWEDIPVFVKAGAIIPTAAVGDYTGDPTVLHQPLTLHCYAGGSGTFMLYEDDEHTYAYEQGQYALTPLRFTDGEETIALELGPTNGPYAPPERDYLAAVRNLRARPAQVTLQGDTLREAALDTILAGLANAWAYDAEARTCYARFRDTRGVQMLELARVLDLTPPGVDTVYCATPESLVVRFSERVLPGTGPNGAANPENYRISAGVRVHAATLLADARAVGLRTTAHQDTVTYEITIAAIADQSPQRNLMPEVRKTYRCGTTRVDLGAGPPPSAYALHQNHPNPFGRALAPSNTTTIRYELPQAGPVLLRVYNLLGEVVATLVEERQTPGSYQVVVPQQAWSSGLYFYRLEAGDFSSTRRMLVLR